MEDNKSLRKLLSIKRYGRTSLESGRSGLR